MNPLLGPLCAFMSSVTWAVGSTAYSRLAAQYSAFAVSFTRAVIGLVAFGLIAAMTVGTAGFAEITSSNTIWFIVSMTCSFALGDVFFMWSAHSIGVSSALAIASSYPLWTALAGVALGEKLGTAQLAGLLLTVAGVVIVILYGRSEIPTDAATPDRQVAPTVARRRSSSQVGVLLAFATSGFWAVNSFAVARGAHGLDLSVANTLRMSIAIVLSLVYGRILAPGAAWRLPMHEVTKRSAVFFIEAVLGTFFFLYGFQHSSVPVAAALASLAPVLVVPVAWWMGMETISLRRSIGIACVVAGIALLMTAGTFR